MFVHLPSANQNNKIVSALKQIKKMNKVWNSYKIRVAQKLQAETSVEQIHDRTLLILTFDLFYFWFEW